MSAHPLVSLLAEAADERFPPVDGVVDVWGPPPGRSQAVVAFTGHSVVATAVPEPLVRERLDPHDFGAAMNPSFLAWVASQLGCAAGMIDLMTVATRRGGDVTLIRRDDLVSHPRMARAARYREDLAVYTDPGERGVVALGRGLARRLELAIEIERAHRDAGLAREMIGAAAALAPADEPLWAQVTPGNAASLRAFLAAGYRIVGSECLFLPAAPR